MTNQLPSRLSVAQRQAIQWLSRLNQPKCSVKVRQQFQIWLHASVENTEAFNMIEQFWSCYADLQTLACQELQQARGFAKRQQQIKRRRGMGLCLLGLMMVYLGSDFDHWLSFGARSYRTAKGQSLNLQLSDGSHIQLNTDSRLLVADLFGWRKVWLQQGEAWFDIHHDPNNTFVIETAQGRIEDIGTRFNILTDRAKTIVTVEEGRIELVFGEARLAVDENQQAILDAKGHWQHKTVTDTDTIAAWRSGLLIFQNQSLSDVLQQLSRYHQVEFTLAQDALKHKLISGRFVTHDLPASLHTLALGMNLEITLTRPSHYLIRKRS